MDLTKFKHLAIQFYRVFRKLPAISKISALIGMVVFYNVLFPRVDDHLVLEHFAYGTIETTIKDVPFFINGRHLKRNEIPDEYINSVHEPRPGELVALFTLRGYDDRYFLYRREDGSHYQKWLPAAYKYLKREKRENNLGIFMLSMGICLAAHRGLFDRLIEILKSARYTLPFK